MTTPPPIPAEAMDGRECLVISPKGKIEFGKYIEGAWRVRRPGKRRGIEIMGAIPLSWCLAAPGMRSVLQLFHDIQIKNGHHICEEIPGGCPVKIALAACEKDGE